MFFLIWGFRRRVVDAGHATYHCPACKRVQPFAVKQIARYFTLFFIPVLRTGAAVEYAVCLRCNHAHKRALLDAAPPVAATATALPPRERPTLQDPPPAARPAATRAADLPSAPRPAAAAAFIAEPHPVAPRPAFGQSAFAKATYARKRRPAPGFGSPAPSGPTFFTPRR